MNHSFKWQGRNDGEGEAHLRLHQVVNTSQHPSYALIGFSSDEGVKRNKGRIGAADAPDMIRAQLANLPVHQSISIADLGTVVCDQGKLEQAQAELADCVERTLQQGIKPVVLGGGHEVAFGSFSGLFQYIRNNEPNAKIGIINAGNKPNSLKTTPAKNNGKAISPPPKIAERIDCGFGTFLFPF